MEHLSTLMSLVNSTTNRTGNNYRVTNILIDIMYYLLRNLKCSFYFLLVLKYKKHKHLIPTATVDIRIFVSFCL